VRFEEERREKMAATCKEKSLLYFVYLDIFALSSTRFRTEKIIIAGKPLLKGIAQPS